MTSIRSQEYNGVLAYNWWVSDVTSFDILMRQVKPFPGDQQVPFRTVSA